MNPQPPSHTRTYHSFPKRGSSDLSSSSAGQLRRPLGEDALQGAAMHLQAPRGLRHIAVAEFKHALDMFPAHALGRHRLVRRRRMRGIAPPQGPIAIVGLGEIGRAPASPVTHAHLVCWLLPDKQNTTFNTTH